MTAMMRSLLFLPGNREKFLEKAASLDADGFIVDFEDSVPEAGKAAARQGLAAHAPALRGKSLWVRPNASDSPYFAEDLAAICRTPGVAGVFLPKAEVVSALREVDAAIGAQERAAGLSPGSLKVILTIETARGVARALDLAEATARTQSLAFGGARDGDLMTDLGCVFSNQDGTLQHAREQVLIAARAAGCRCPLDSVFADVKDLGSFEADTRQSRALGYRGRALIHPVADRARQPALQPGARRGRGEPPPGRGVRGCRRQGSRQRAVRGPHDRCRDGKGGEERARLGRQPGAPLNEMNREEQHDTQPSARARGARRLARRWPAQHPRRPIPTGRCAW